MQIAALEQSQTGNQQSTSTDPSICSSAGELRHINNAAAHKLVDTIKQAAESLKQYQPDELTEGALHQDTKAAEVDQLLMSLQPQLQGDLKQLLAAVAQMQKPLTELSVPDHELATASEEVEALKQTCLFGHQPNLSNWIAQVEAHCTSLQSWLAGAGCRLAEYQAKLAAVQCLQHRAAVCTKARNMIRAT